MAEYDHDQSDVAYDIDGSEEFECPVCGDWVMRGAMASHLYRGHWHEICDAFDYCASSK